MSNIECRSSVWVGILSYRGEREDRGENNQFNHPAAKPDAQYWMLVSWKNQISKPVLSAVEGIKEQNDILKFKESAETGNFICKSLLTNLFCG